MRERMKNIIKTIICIIALTGTFSCSKFLQETPQTFLTPDTFYSDATNISTMVNGLYTGVSNTMFSSAIGFGLTQYTFLEGLAGHNDRTRVSGTRTEVGLQFPILEDNFNLSGIWQYAYESIENCNDAIRGISTSEGVISDSDKAQYLGEAYFLRAYYYFILVRHFGPIPYRTTVTTGFAEAAAPCTPIADVYDGIVADLKLAEECFEGKEWTNNSGRATKGAVKSLLAEVYLTMAGYPLQKKECYDLAYEKAKEVKESGAFTLFEDYKALRNPSNENTGEFIFSVQREANNAGSPVHQDCLPYPELSNEAEWISPNVGWGGSIVPNIHFYNSYKDGDKRKEEGQYFYTKATTLAGSEITLSRPYYCKFWSDEYISSSKSGANYSVIRYAGVLLTLAEAACKGGSTTDAAAIDAYYQVHHRALAGDPKPSKLTEEQVLKEKCQELCVESIVWYDMLRTRKAYDSRSDSFKALVGYQSEGHYNAFSESDLLMPYPIREKRLNPNLVR